MVDSYISPSRRMQWDWHPPGLALPDALSDGGCRRQSVRRSSCRARGSLASLRGRRVAAAGWGQEDEVSQSVPRPGGIAASRFRTLNEITSPIVPTGTTRLRPRQAKTGTSATLRSRALRLACPSGTRCHQPTCGAGSPPTCERPRRARAMPRRLAMFMPQARNADHLVLRISSEWAAS